MPDPTSILAAETLAHMTPEARTVAMIRRSISIADMSGAPQLVVITDEIRQICDEILARDEQPDARNATR
jgi:hypothetical protein